MRNEGKISYPYIFIASRRKFTGDFCKIDFLQIMKLPNNRTTISRRWLSLRQTRAENNFCRCLLHFQMQTNKPMSPIFLDPLKWFNNSCLKRNLNETIWRKLNGNLLRMDIMHPRSNSCRVHLFQNCKKPLY